MIADDFDAQLDRRLRSLFATRAETAEATSPSVDDAIAALHARVRPTRAPGFGASQSIAVLAGRRLAAPSQAWVWLLIALLALGALALGSAIAGNAPRPSHLATAPHRNGVIVVFGGVGTGYLAVDPISRAVTPFHASGGTVTWSPDGTRLASEYDGAVWVQDAQTGATTRVAAWSGTSFGSLPASNHQPVAWSPDGSRLAFSNDGEIWTVRLDGSELRQLTHSGGATAGAIQPAWSPDGSRIAFTSMLGGLPVSLATIRTDGTDLQAIVQAVSAGQNDPQRTIPSSPVWSPDGSRIAYLEEVGLAETMRVVTIRPDGSDRRVIFAAPTCCVTDWGDLSWSPDGTKLATITRGSQGGKESLIVMNSDGTGVVELLQSANPGPVAWRPVP